MADEKSSQCTIDLSALPVRSGYSYPARVAKIVDAANGIAW